MKVKTPIQPTKGDIQKAHKLFLDIEPRNVFYRASIELVELALNKKTTLSVPEALSLLLQTWNKALYRFHPFTGKDMQQIENIYYKHETTLLKFRKRSIMSYKHEDDNEISMVFENFEKILYGPVGAAKCLHICAHRYFPLWDRAIAYAYGCRFIAIKDGTNAKTYIGFIETVKKQIENYGGESAFKTAPPLKALDEYNFCRFTNGLM